MAGKKIREDSGITFETAPKVLTPEQVQELLQISRTSFFRWVQAGKLPGAFRLERLWRVDRDTLKAWIESQARK